MITGYYTPHQATTSNTKRSGTYRVGSDQSTPIIIHKAQSEILHFSFRDHNQRPVSITGRNFTASIYTYDGTQVWQGPLIDNSLLPGSATLNMNANATSALCPGLYKISINYIEGSQTYIVSTASNLNRWVLEVIDF